MVSIAACLAAFAFGFFGSVPLVGPIALMVVSRAASGKHDEARRIGLGAAAAEGVYAGVAFWGFATFLASHPVVVPVSHATTALILTGLGVRFVFWKPPSDAGDRGAKAAGTFLVGFSVSALNPTLLLTWSTAVAFLYSKGLRGEPAILALPFGAAAAAGVASWIVLLVILLRRYEGRLPPVAMTWVIRAMGLVLVGLGVWSTVQLVRWLAHAAA